MNKEATLELLEKMVEDVLSFHSQLKNGDLSTGDFEFMVDQIIADYADKLL